VDHEQRALVHHALVGGHRDERRRAGRQAVEGSFETADALAVLVIGQKWLADYMREPVEERPIRVWPIEPHAGTQQAIAEVCRRTMAAIDEADAKFREATKEAA